MTQNSISNGFVRIAQYLSVKHAKHDCFLEIHNIVSRTGSVNRAHDSSKVNDLCAEHPDKEISGYCNDCGVSCMTCITEKHRRHDGIAIEMKYMECEDRLNDVVMDIKKNEIVRLQSGIVGLQEKLISSEKKLSK